MTPRFPFRSGPAPLDAPSRASSPLPWMAVGAFVLCLVPGRNAAGQSATGVVLQDASGDRLTYSARAATYVPIFRRALLPGPAGATVKTETAVPVHQYVLLTVGAVDSPWGTDAVDAELSMWAAGNAVDVDHRSRLDAEISVASVSHRIGPGMLKVGRQIQTAGAARFASFDGVTGTLRTDSGIGATAYGGFTVLPRWSDRPGYQQLGAAFDTLVEDESAFPEAERSGSWLLGGRLSYAREDLGELGASLHEQRENDELSRRDLGLDLHLDPLEEAALNVRALVDLDSSAVSDAVATVDIHPAEVWDLAVTYRRVTPSLLLSRQSVLSVFSVDRFDELGAGAAVYPMRQWALEIEGALNRVESGDPGYRGEVGVTLRPDGAGRWTLLFDYARVGEDLNGYHSLHMAARYHLAHPVSIVGEHYSFLYDRPVRRLGSSNVEGASLEWQAAEAWNLLLGGSAVRSPYARLDAQLLLRVVYAADSRDGGRW